MSTFPYRVSLVFLNFFGICCHSFTKGKFVVSKLWVLYSVVKIAPFFVVQVLLQISPSFRTSVLNRGLNEINNLSYFTFLMIGVINLTVMTSCTLISILGIWKSNKIVAFFHFGLELHSKLDESYIKKLRSCLIKLIVVTLVFSSCFARIMLSTMKSDVLSTFVGIVMVHPPFTILSFLSFLKFAELFILQLLRNFTGNLAKFSKKSAVSKNFAKLANEYQNIYAFCTGFNRLFGVQLTMIAVTLTIVTVFDVSLSKNQDEVI